MNIECSHFHLRRLNLFLFIFLGRNLVHFVKTTMNRKPFTDRKSSKIKPSSNSMFTFCENTPVKKCDASGDYAHTLRIYCPEWESFYAICLWISTVIDNWTQCPSICDLATQTAPIIIYMFGVCFFLNFQFVVVFNQISFCIVLYIIVFFVCACLCIPQYNWIAFGRDFNVKLKHCIYSFVNEFECHQ